MKQENNSSSKKGSSAMQKGAHIKFDEQVSRLTTLFKALELVLHRYHVKKRSAPWLDVKTGIEQITEMAVELSDICLMKAIFDESFLICWEFDETAHSCASDFKLCLSVQHASQAKVAVDRSEIFRSRAERFVHQDGNGSGTLNTNVQLSEGVLKVDRNIVLPPKPAMKSNLLGNKKRKCFAGDSDNKRQKNQLTVPPVSSSNHTSIIASCSSQGNDLNHLREKIAERENLIQKNAIESKVDKEKSIRVARHQKLPAVCDALRSLFQGQNRSKMVTSTCIAKLSDQLRQKPEEITKLLKILNEVVPEFISIFPPDKHMPHSTVQINFSSSYGDIRRKVSLSSKTVQ